MKALAQLGHLTEPSASSIFLASLCVALRFTGAAFIMGIWLGRKLISTTRLEWIQGGGIGVFGGLGLVLQMDGMTYTLASTSAFLTQGYAVLIPLWVAFTQRKHPRLAIIGACTLAVLGAGILGWDTSSQAGIRFGRGEAETLLGSVFFAAQILWLERPCFAINHSLRVSTLMFAVIAMTCWLLVWLTAPTLGVMVRVYSTPAGLGLLLFLTCFCTLVTFPLANYWQPKVSATQAGLLYCTEPMFTSLVALFVPGILSGLIGVQYPNETLTWNLVVGGGLILAANGWLQLCPEK